MQLFSSRSRRARRRRPRVAIVVDEASQVAAKARNEGPVPVEAVSEALFDLSYEPVLVRFGNDPKASLDELMHGGFCLMFNLCEGVSGRPAAEHLPPSVAELLGIPTTGARSATLSLCLRKDRTNAVLKAHGILVPDWMTVRTAKSAKGWCVFPAILKPAAEDGSVGIGPDAIVHARAALRAGLEQSCRRWDRVLIQRFVAGREFALAIVGGQQLPPSEIDFGSLPDGLPPVVTYAAKWIPGSEEDKGMAPRCPASIDTDLARRLSRVANEVWALVDGTGYGRIDVRVDAGGSVYVIDVNPNPDLSPDAGFARQAAAANWGYAGLIARIVEDALTRKDPTGRNRSRWSRDRAQHSRWQARAHSSRQAP